MKKFLNLINFFELKLSTVIVLILGVLFGQAKPLLLLFLIAIIHELFHYFACIILKIKVRRFIILPFGASLQINEVENISSIKQIFIYLAGPLSMFVNLIWINLLKNNGILNEINYDFIIRINYVMCIVNLLPIFPLDGYMIIKAIMQLFNPYKKALKISLIVSLIAFGIFLTYNFVSFQPMISIFLLFEQIRHILNYKELYKKFLIYKSLFKKHKRYRIIDDYQMYKDCNNYKFENAHILNDMDIALKELSKNRFIT